MEVKVYMSHYSTSLLYIIVMSVFFELLRVNCSD